MLTAFGYYEAIGDTFVAALPPRRVGGHVYRGQNV